MSSMDGPLHCKGCFDVLAWWSGAVVGPACLRGADASGPDGIRGQGPILLIGLRCPEHLAGCPHPRSDRFAITSHRPRNLWVCFGREEPIVDTGPKDRLLPQRGQCRGSASNGLSGDSAVGSVGMWTFSTWCLLRAPQQTSAQPDPHPLRSRSSSKFDGLGL